MNHRDARRPRTPSHRPWATSIAVLTVGCLTFLIPGARVEGGTPPQVPSGLEVPAGNRPFLRAHAVGTQTYVCLTSPSGYTWGFFGPQATLFTVEATPLVTHFVSPNPNEGGTPRATWQHSRDTSRVWARQIAMSSDPAFVEHGAIPWLLLGVVGAEFRPSGSRKLSDTTYIQRLRTSGGLAPMTGCAEAPDVGKKALVPYAADYVFYRGARS